MLIVPLGPACASIRALNWLGIASWMDPCVSTLISCARSSAASIRTGPVFERMKTSSPGSKTATPFGGVDRDRTGESGDLLGGPSTHDLNFEVCRRGYLPPTFEQAVLHGRECQPERVEIGVVDVDIDGRSEILRGPSAGRGDRPVEAPRDLVQSPVGVEFELNGRIDDQDVLGGEGHRSRSNQGLFGVEAGFAPDLRRTDQQGSGGRARNEEPGLYQALWRSIGQARAKTIHRRRSFPKVGRGCNRRVRHDPVHRATHIDVVGGTLAIRRPPPLT